MAKKATKFRGIVKSLSSDRRSALVILDGENAMREYAVVSTRTKRIGSSEQLRRLSPGLAVEGVGHVGPEAIIADEIELSGE